MERLAEFGRLRVVCGPAPCRKVTRRWPGRHLDCSTRKICGPQLAHSRWRLQKSANGSGAMRRGPLEWKPGPCSLPFPRLSGYGIAATPPGYPSARCARPGLDPAVMRGDCSVTREWQDVNSLDMDRPSHGRHYRPTQSEQVIATRLLCRELLVKLPQAARKFLHSPPYYPLG